MDGIGRGRGHSLPVCLPTCLPSKLPAHLPDSYSPASLSLSLCVCICFFLPRAVRFSQCVLLLLRVELPSCASIACAVRDEVRGSHSLTRSLSLSLPLSVSSIPLDGRLLLFKHSLMDGMAAIRSCVCVLWMGVWVGVLCVYHRDKDRREGGRQRMFLPQACLSVCLHGDRHDRTHHMFRELVSERVVHLELTQMHACTAGWMDGWRHKHTYKCTARMKTH